MTDTMTPAEAFPPGEYLRDELAERGWAEREFAEIIGRAVQVVSEILNVKKDITPETAIAIGAALGTSAELWMNMQAAFRLQQVRSSATPTIRPVERRAMLRSLVPVRELQRRGWLPATSDLDELEGAICDLLRLDDITQTPQLAVAAGAPTAMSGSPRNKQPGSPASSNSAQVGSPGRMTQLRYLCSPRNLSTASKDRMTSGTSGPGWLAAGWLW
ncbi:MAG: HigA family addiction module antitoxin [Acidimicrobiales bacterium]